MKLSKVISGIQRMLRINNYGVGLYIVKAENEIRSCKTQEQLLICKNWIDQLNLADSLKSDLYNRIETKQNQLIAWDSRSDINEDFSI